MTLGHKTSKDAAWWREHPMLTRFIAGRFLATITYQMTSVTVGIEIYERTRQPIDLAWVGLAQFLPMLVLAIPGGEVADRFNRAATARNASVLFAFIASALLATALVGGVPLLVIYAILVLFGIGRAFYGPAISALLPQTVSEVHLAKAVALQSGFWQAAAIGGPALAGLLYGVAGHSGVVYAVACGTALASAFILGTLARRVESPGQEATRHQAARDLSAGEAARQPAGKSSAGSEVATHHTATSTPGAPQDHPHRNLGARISAALEGLRFVAAHPLLFPALMLDFLAVLLGGATALIPAFASDVLGGGPELTGLLRAAPGVGAALAAFVLTRYPIKARVGAALFVSVAVFGACTIAFGASTSIPAALILLALAGAADMVSAVLRGTLVQTATPPHMRGRVSAVNLLFISASNELGEFESGVVAQWAGVVPCIVYGGGGTVLVVLACAAYFRSLFALDRMDDAAPRTHPSPDGRPADRP